MTDNYAAKKVKWEVAKQSCKYAISAKVTEVESPSDERQALSDSLQQFQAGRAEAEVASTEAMATAEGKRVQPTVRIGQSETSTGCTDH